MHPRLVALMLVLCIAGHVSSAFGDVQTYTDDFATDKAMSDSYSHSDFLEDLPDPWPEEGFLRYEPPTGDRALALYSGTGDEQFAWLLYDFPIVGVGAVFDAGAVEFDLVATRDGGWVQWAWSFDQQGEWTEAPAEGVTGHYRYDFAGPFPFEVLHVEVRGCNASVDSFELTLHHWTPVEPGTWSRIKSLYRRPA